MYIPFKNIFLQCKHDMRNHVSNGIHIDFYRFKQNLCIIFARKLVYFLGHLHCQKKLYTGLSVQSLHLANLLSVLEI